MKILISVIIIFYLFVFNVAHSFRGNPTENEIGTGGREDLSHLKAKNSNFKKGKDALKQALKYQKKSKIGKANKKFEKALKYFVSAYEEVPDNIETIYLLGFTYNKLGDLLMAEIYYKDGLSISPNNVLINKKLGELYINTKRMKFAKERLKVLSSCGCKEYTDLKSIIEKN